MRLILSDFISLDGVVQAPGGPEEDTENGFRHGGWSMPLFDPDLMGTAIEDLTSRVEALLYGRRTWEMMAGHWPNQTDDPYADKLNELPKYVASRTLSPDDVSRRWSNSSLLPAEDAVSAIGELRGSEGDGVIQVWGSSVLAKQLIEADLVDEYQLMIEPIILGGGKSIYPVDGEARHLELVSVTRANTGVLICHYRPSPD